MRSTAAIFLITLLTINWYGYDMFLAILNQREQKTVSADFEAGRYRQDELLEIKVDLELPYATDWANFEKVSGTIVVEGVIYNFVERKFLNGHMVYHCLPNYKSTTIQNARDYFHTLVYNLEKQESKKPVPTAPALRKLQIETTLFAENKLIIPAAGPSPLPFAHHIRLQCDGFGNIPTQPPDA